MSTIYRPDIYDVVNEHQQRLREMEQGCPPFVVPPNDQLLNDWTQSYLDDPQWEPWGYRVCDGQLEFKGHLTPGTLGTAAYTLPANYRILDGNPTWVSHMVTSSTTFVLCHIKIDMVTGNIYIYGL